MKNRKKTLNIPMTRCYHQTDKSWTDYRALTKKGFLASIDGLCNHFFRLFKMDGNDLKTYFCINKSFAFITSEQRGKTCLLRYVTCVESENKSARYSYLILIDILLRYISVLLSKNRKKIRDFE